MKQPIVEDKGLRLDKWLWAARFFKTRNLAKTAVEQGKVRCQGQRCRASRQVEVGMLLSITQGLDVREIEVLALTHQRGPASVAQGLYAETPDSLKKRTEAAVQRKLAGQLLLAPEHRPDKKSRRQIHRFKRQEPS